MWEKGKVDSCENVKDAEMCFKLDNFKTYLTTNFELLFCSTVWLSHELGYIYQFWLHSISVDLEGTSDNCTRLSAHQA